jgi:gamma-glutamyltranspeptidase/glutathione hydrolase
VFGTPGGTTITTSVFQTLVDILELNMSPEDAVNKPKFHHQWLPDLIYVEKDFPQDIRLGLEKMGYQISQRDAIGRTELIQIDSTGKITAIGDKRGDDTAVGY